MGPGAPWEDGNDEERGLLAPRDRLGWPGCAGRSRSGCAHPCRWWGCLHGLSSTGMPCSAGGWHRTEMSICVCVSLLGVVCMVCLHLGTLGMSLCVWLGVPCIHRESGQCQRGERGHPPGPGPDLVGAEQPLSCPGESPSLIPTPHVHPAGMLRTSSAELRLGQIHTSIEKGSPAALHCGLGASCLCTA